MATRIHQIENDEDRLTAELKQMIEVNPDVVQRLKQGEGIAGLGDRGASIIGRVLEERGEET